MRSNLADKQEIYMNMFITQLARIMEEIFIGANKDIKQKLKKYKTNFHALIAKQLGGK